MTSSRLLAGVLLGGTALGGFAVGWMMGSSGGARNAPASELSALGKTAAATDRPANADRAQAGADETSSGENTDSTPGAQVRGQGKEPVTLEDLQAIIEERSGNHSMLKYAEIVAEIRKRVDPAQVPALLEECYEMKGKDLQHSYYLLTALISHYARHETDVAKIVALAEKAPQEHLKNAGLQAAMQMLARQDKERALAALNLIDDPARAESVRSSVDFLLLADKPREYLDKIQQNPPGRGNHNAGWHAGYMLAELAGEDADEAFRRLNEFRDQNILENAARSFGYFFNEDQFDEFWERSQKLENAAARNQLQESLLENLLSIDVEKAMAMHGQMPAGSAYQEVAGDIAAVLMKKDPAAALEWVETLPYGAAYEQALRQIGSEIMAAPQETLAWLEKLPVTEGRASAMNSALQQFSRNDPAAAADFVRKNQGDEQVTRTLHQITHNWSERDPRAAAQFALSLENDTNRQNAVNGVLSGWSNRDPAAAAEWTLRLENKDDRKKAVRHVANNWASRDLDKVGQWVERIVEPDVKQVAIEGVAGNLAYQRPRQAIDWASRITNDEQRHRVQERAAREWLKWQKAEATEWITQSDLPEETRNNLLK